MTKLEKELLKNVVYQWDYVESAIRDYCKNTTNNDLDDYVKEQWLLENKNEMTSFIEILRNALGCGSALNNDDDTDTQEADNAESKDD